MTTDSEDLHISTIVRRYSNQVAAQMPQNTLAQALNEHEVALQARDNEAVEWRKWLRFDEPSSDDEMSSLREVAKEAAELWRKLKLDLGDLGHDPDNPPTVKNLSLAVSEAQHAWNMSKRTGLGKAKERFASFLDTMDQYKYLFSIIPKGDKYTSLFTGVVSTVVKASRNNEHLAEGFSEALQDMGRDMHLVQRMSQRCDTPSMRQHVISLYREVFTLLCYAMQWYQSKSFRFRKAFNNKFYDETVKDRVKRIQGHLQRTRDEMNLLASENLELISVRQEKSHDGIFARMDDLNQKFDVIARLLVGKEMSSTLYANAEQGTYMFLYVLSEIFLTYGD
ncbi:hypothetical protein E8E14_005304 [Neopestalotiopsis sp. 37M]|nr:hypothetical protein E8E14_005304 [Neopestalotiopsis sp. 37M]